MLWVLETRYSRLALWVGFAETLPRWQSLRVAVVGCGGLGCSLVEQLARLGAGSAVANHGVSGGLVIIDRDCVTPENLGHQVLFGEEEARLATPKALAAASAVARINSRVRTQPEVAALTRHNICELLDGAHIIFDGLDNYYTRLLLNDYALANGVPLIHAGVVRAEMSALAVLPGRKGCLRCVMDHPPGVGEAPTCASEGVFGPLLGVAAAVQISMANDWLAGKEEQGAKLLTLDASTWRWRETDIGRLRDDCPACVHGCYEYLDGSLDALSQAACSEGRTDCTLPVGTEGLDLDMLAAKLARAGRFSLTRNRYLLRAEDGKLRYTLFASGRVMLEGSNDPGDLDSFVLTYLGL